MENNTFKTRYEAAKQGWGRLLGKGKKLTDADVAELCGYAGVSAIGNALVREAQPPALTVFVNLYERLPAKNLT